MEEAKKQQNGVEEAVVEEQQNSGEKDEDGDEEDANDDKKDEEEDEEKVGEEEEGRDGVEDEEEGKEVNDAASSAHSCSKRGNPMSDEKSSAMDEGDTVESNRERGREMPSTKTISPHTSPRSLHSPPLKITESLRFLSQIGRAHV